MDLVALLQNWNYEQAREFYLEVGENQTLIGMLGRAKNSFLENQLRSELRNKLRSKLQKMQVHSEIHPKAHPKAHSEIHSTFDSAFHSSPYFAQKTVPQVTPQVAQQKELEEGLGKELKEELEKIHVEWRRDYKKASRLQMTLTQAPNDEARCKMAFEILELMDEVHDHWDNLAYYKEHGELMPQAVQVDFDWRKFSKAELIQQLRNYRTYLSPSKATKYSLEKRAEFQAKIKFIEKILPEVETD